MTNHFPNNLALLRRKAGYTQEALAEALSVSRQAISKWESGLTMPEAATLITLADLLGCTLDELVREELTEESFSENAVPEDAPDGPSEEDAALYASYHRHMNRFAWLMAGGVALILIGVALVLLCCNLIGESGLISLPLLACVAAAVFLFIFGGIGHGDFMRAHPCIPDCSLPGEREGFQRRFRIGIAGAVVGILADVALLVVLAIVFGHSEPAIIWAAALFLFILAFCVGALVLLGVLHSKYDLEGYAREAAKEEDDKVSGVIMLVATAVFLLLGFLGDLWHPGWVVFPVGGILCGIVDTIRKKK